MNQDPIAEMLTRIRNASMARKPEAVISVSKIKWEIARILREEGYLKEIAKTDDNHGQIRVALKYDSAGVPVIKSLKRASKPGRKVYVNKNRLPIVLNNLGVAIVSTSQGLMTNKEAKKRGLGGEVILEVY